MPRVFPIESTTYWHQRVFADGYMEDRQLESMTIRQLLDIYNGYGPVRPLKTWKGKKVDLIARIRVADKQSGLIGEVID